MNKWIIKKMTHSMVLAFFLFSASSLQAMHLFYQPQTRDAGVSQAHWQQIWDAAYQHGYRTIIVQWTRHGDEDFGGADGWLHSTLQLAETSGLSLIVGLNYDTDYYPVMEQGNSTIYFWHHLLSQARQQQQALLKHWQVTLTGWYLPYELDDTLFRSRDLLHGITTQLASLAATSELPVHVSAFSSGQLGPRVYADWLSMISAAGVTVWWQDGQGTGLLSAVVRDAYEQALSCDIGVVHEAFSQTSGVDEPFSAVPEHDFQTPGASTDCHPRAVFSLRYLPFAKRLL